MRHPRWLMSRVAPSHGMHSGIAARTVVSEGFCLALPGISFNVVTLEEILQSYPLVRLLLLHTVDPSAWAGIAERTKARSAKRATGFSMTPH